MGNLLRNSNYSIYSFFLYFQSAHNFTLPSWLNDTVESKLRSLTNQQVTLRFSSTEKRRLKGGKIFTHVNPDISCCIYYKTNI